jgi:hypothetical protein
MKRTKEVTSAETIVAGPAATLPYRGAPTGAVVASDAALAALSKKRPLALAFAILLFTYAAVGGTVGVVWLIILVRRLIMGPAPTPPFINVASINLLFAPIALVGALLTIAYFRAAGRACGRRSSDDLERASIAQKRLWLWLAVAIVVVIAFAATMILVAMFVTHDWPG